ncbi:MAG: energy transducer TonB [Desulfatiglandales bacterium]
MAKYFITLVAAIFVTLLLCFTPFERTTKEIFPTISMQEPIAVRTVETPEKKRPLIRKEKEPPKILKLSRSKVRASTEPKIPLSISPAQLELDFSPKVTADLKAPITEFKDSGQIGNVGGKANTGLVFNAGDVDVPPRIKKYFPPLYPPKARGQRVEGKVMIRALVLPNGLPQKVRVISSEPEGYFERAAMDAVWRWTFYPAEEAGEKVKVLVDIPIEFKLNN